VFVDRHLEVGMRWAEAIDREIREAAVVIPLLSEASIRSEMLAHEVQIAQEAAQRQGLPRLLPIRLNFEGALPEQLGVVLDPIEYDVWKPGETADLAERLIRVIDNPPRRGAVPLERLEPPGGAVPLDSRFYVVRPADEGFRAALARRDSIVLMKGGRQIGKTSLLARGLQQARSSGARVIRSDFQKLNARHLENPDALLKSLAESIAEQLDLELDVEEIWSDRRGPSENFERFWRRHALRSTDGHVVWGLDEVDRLFACDFASEVFGLFRSWHNERALDPEGPWNRLTLAIAYATEAHLFISDVNQSPFNVGTRLALADFDVEQVADLNGRYGTPLQGREEIAGLHELLGGQPYLTRRGLHEMAAQGIDFAALRQQVDRDEGIFGDHLRRILVLLARDVQMSDVLRGVLRGEPCPTAESFYRLRSGGLLSGDTMREARMRCRIYSSYLSRHLS